MSSNRRLAVDFALLAMALPLLAYQWTGNALHEWGGIALLVLVIVHNASNFAWYKRALHPVTLQAWLRTTVNFLLAVSFLVLIGSAIAISRTVFPFPHGSGGLVLRQIHVSAAYWFLVLAAFHLGLHWEGVSGRIFGIMGRVGKNRAFVVTLRILAFVAALWGVREFVNRDVFYKLILYNSFGPDGAEETLMSNLAGHLCLLCAFALPAHYIGKIRA
jgi:hypothetical protein